MGRRGNQCLADGQPFVVTARNDLGEARLHLKIGVLDMPTTMWYTFPHTIHAVGSRKMYRSKEQMLHETRQHWVQLQNRCFPAQFASAASGILICAAECCLSSVRNILHK
jgi:hypothetical protein